jgi:mannose-1-phosphate guanylyltransferase
LRAAKSRSGTLTSSFSGLYDLASNVPLSVKTERQIMPTKNGKPLSTREVILDVIWDYPDYVADALESLRTAVRDERVPHDARRWGLILAGGDGVRLRPLTRLVSGDNRPKQFCRLLGNHTLLRQAQHRAERSIRPDQILYSVTRAHRDYYAPELACRTSQIIVQPCNKGTAPAILSSLLHIFRMDPDAVVAILPCDHYYSAEHVFTTALESAFQVAKEQSSSVVLLSARPYGAEVEYGWIELGEAVRGCHTGVFRVKRFHEKPLLSVAEHLLRTGGLWNTFVMVGQVGAFLELALASVPGLMKLLGSGAVCSCSRGETRITDKLYDRIDGTDFSRQVLAPGASRLVALNLGQVDWNDLGDPQRVISTLLDRGFGLPSWAVQWLRQNDATRLRQAPCAIPRRMGLYISTR